MTTMTTPRRSNGRSNNDRSRGAQYDEWREAVLKRDEYACRGCGRTDHLEAHHNLPWEKFPGLRYDVDNGVTLCTDCHALADPDRRPAGSKRNGRRRRGHKVGVWLLQGLAVYFLVVTPLWTLWILPTYAKPHDVYSLWGWLLWQPPATVAGIYLARLAWRGLRSATGLFRTY